jgi:hypothetical protein
MEAPLTRKERLDDASFWIAVKQLTSKFQASAIVPLLTTLFMRSENSMQSLKRLSSADVCDTPHLL